MRSWTFVLSTARFKVECIKSTFLNTFLLSLVHFKWWREKWILESTNIPCSFSFTVIWVACIIITKEPAKCCLKKSNSRKSTSKGILHQLLNCSSTVAKEIMRVMNPNSCDEREKQWRKITENTTDRQHIFLACRQQTWSTSAVQYIMYNV